jgi:TonB family protein
MRRFTAVLVFSLVTLLASAQEPPPPPSKPGGAVTAPSAAVIPDSTSLVQISGRKPVYPLSARDEGIQGQVWVRLQISETGDVTAVEVISGDPILAQSVVETCKKYKYKPYIRNGVPIKITTKLPFDFYFKEKTRDIKPKDAVLKPEAADSNEVKRVAVAQGVSQGLLVHRVTPVYPEKAKQKLIQGTVVLHATIGRNGRLLNLTAVSGPPELIPAAIGAVQQWIYRPYLLNGEPVEVDTQVTINFTYHQ